MLASKRKCVNQMTKRLRSSQQKWAALLPACCLDQIQLLTLIHPYPLLSQCVATSNDRPLAHVPGSNKLNRRVGVGFALRIKSQKRIKIPIKSIRYIILILLVFLYLFDFIVFFGYPRGVASNWPSRARGGFITGFSTSGTNRLTCPLPANDLHKRQIQWLPVARW